MYIIAMPVKKSICRAIFLMLALLPIACYVESNLADFPDEYNSRSALPPPAGWWRLNDVRNNTAFDSSGYNLHGRVYGAVPSGAALSFDGRDDCIKVDDSPALRPRKITVQAWFNARSISQAVIMEKIPGGAYPPQKGWQLWIDTELSPKNTIMGCVLNRPAGEAGARSSTAIQPGQWYHVALTFDGGYICLYLNGALEGSSYSPTLIGDNKAASLTIGYSEYWMHNYFNGLIKDARIYGYARSPEAIRNDYNSGRPEESDYQEEAGPISPGGTWLKVNPANSPSARHGSGMAYDSARQKTVLFGGSNNETWEYDPSSIR